MITFPKLSVATTLLILSSATSGAQQNPAEVGGVAAVTILEKLGARMERGITPKQLEDYSRHFDLIDRDRDGRHSKVEYIDNGNYLNPQARRGIFNAADGDKDGFVTKAEYTLNRIITDEAKAIVQSMDDNKDRVVQRAEFLKHAHENLPNGLAGKVFAALDTDGNGELIVPEYLRVWGQWARSGGKTPEQRLIADEQPKPAAANSLGLVPEGWRDGWVIANGIRIHYWRTGGDKPVIVMAHGYSDDGRCWANFAKELESAFDLILVDARGHGLSDPPSKGDPANAQAEDLAGLIRELKLEKPIVMGHSMGSASAALFAATYPDLPRAVVLEDPRLVERAQGFDRNEQVQERQRAAIVRRNNTSIETLVADCLKRNPKWGRSECEFWAPSKRLHHPNNAYRSLGRRPPMTDLFSKITAPTLILKADAEGDVRKKNEEVAGLLKNGRIVHIEGAGHNVRRDEKERTLKALVEFLGTL